jgi:hypothetical protein
MRLNKLIDLEALDYFLGKVKDYVIGLMSNAQEKLISGSNIKTVNNVNVLGEGNIDTGAVTYVTNIIKGEKYNASTGAIESAGENHYRTAPFATLGRFNAKFKWNLTEECTLTAHGWNSHGNYTGGVSITIPAGTNEKDWFLIPGGDDVYYAFDFNTNDTDSSTIFVNITYDYVTKDIIPTKVSQLTNDSNFVTTSALNNKSDKYKTQNITNKVWEDSGSCTLSPNVYSIVEQQSGKEISIFDIFLETPSDNSIVNEYCLQFTTSSHGCSLIVPSSIKWMNGEIPVLEANSTYQLSIINNLAICAVFK